MISGGGTGGHIYPAISIAQALKEILQNVDILFVGAKGKMEMKKVPEAGFKIEGLWISGIQRKLSSQNLLFPAKVISSLLGASRLIKKFNPDVLAVMQVAHCFMWPVKRRSPPLFRSKIVMQA